MEAEAGGRAPPPGGPSVPESSEQQEPEAAPSPSLAESPAPQGRPRSSSGVTEPPRHTSHWGEGMLETPASQERPPKNNRVTEPPRHTLHWGEAMLETPAPRDHPPRNNRVTEPPRHTLHWGKRCWRPRPHRNVPPKTTGSLNPPGTHRTGGKRCWRPRPPETIPPETTESLNPPAHVALGEAMSETPALGDHSPDSIGVGGPWRCPSQQGNGMPEPAHTSGLAWKEPGAQEPAGPPPADEQALLAMLTAVASSQLPVRSQQKDEPDLTAEEKLAILRALYRDKPLVFLERFRRALRVEHLGCFAHLAARYEARFYCDEVRRAARGKAGRTRVRNKRYAALQQLIKGGEYFSDEQMRARDPLLYEQYIGQYLSDEELLALGSQAQADSCSLSGVLLGSYQEQLLQLRLHIQQEQENACMEEEDEDEDDESSSASDAWVPDTEEKAFLREEFTSRMHQRFLDGKDGDFDYSEVDENPEFDNLDIVARDEEERYFDGEEPEEVEEMEAE
ncbi:coiled-coil domain-containing protein 97 isoform X2 [Emydura macquarii macquarii]|uniref:coiled-coil domain-containing protein 97 isoform X2 n=1 Tax=Emydura macquarii macquarii TaxID=1129001 RepID=UPI00352AEF6D